MTSQGEFHRCPIQNLNKSSGSNARKHLRLHYTNKRLRSKYGHALLDCIFHAMHVSLWFFFGVPLVSLLALLWFSFGVSLIFLWLSLASWLLYIISPGLCTSHCGSSKLWQKSLASHSVVDSNLFVFTDGKAKSDWISTTAIGLHSGTSYANEASSDYVYNSIGTGVSKCPTRTSAIGLQKHSSSADASSEYSYRSYNRIGWLRGTPRVLWCCKDIC